MDLAEALRRAAALAGAHSALAPWHEVVDAPAPHAVAIVATEEMDFAAAMALYRVARAQRAELEMSALIVETEALFRGAEAQHVGDDEVASAEAFFDPVLRGDDWTARLEGALDALGRTLGRDPITVLHRIPGDVLGDYAGDDPPEFSEADLIYPDDVEEAFRQELAERERFLSRARGLGPVRIEPLRTYDVASALAEIPGNPSRLVLLAASPSEALRHLGFGAFNACPRPREHAAVWARWEKLYGAEPVALGPASISGFLARPVADRASLVRLAREVAIYDRDALMDGLIPLLAALFRNTSIGFWWD